MDNAFRVIFSTFGGNEIATAVGLFAGDAVERPTDPVKAGYCFGGWYTDKACTKAWDFSDPIRVDMTLYVKWIPRVEQ
ncbi:MAG: InlB B-repeat-containing protein [Methanocalculaceae archaeon]|jgi:uncharacterized repeat protein (TIGR02543 family)|nr:InlB B-repeat-containing protein [Methanocalculaceae archaeon]